MLTAVARILREAVSCEREVQLARACLAAAEELTQSRLGFLGEVDARAGRLQIIATSAPGFAGCGGDPAPGAPRKRLPSGDSVGSLYGRVLASGEGLFTNDPSAQPGGAGTPRGHPPLSAFLGVPLVHSGRTLGMIGLANRDGGYGPAQLEAAEALAPVVAEALVSWRAGAALRRNEEQLRILVDHAPAAVAMFDREMRYLAVSRRFAADYRTSVQDLMGRSHYDVFPEIPERWRRIHERCLAGAIERCDEDPFPRADGTLDWIQWEICPWRTAAGEVGGIILFSEVITGRKRAEEALREREREIERQARELHAVLDTVPAAIYISRDAAGSRIEGNRYGQELLRVPAGDNVSRSAPEHERPTYRVLRNGVEVPPEELPVQVASTRGRSVKDWECTIAFEDGTSVELLGYATPLALGGGGAVAAFVDITARKRAEVALRSQEAWYRALFDSTQQGLFVLEALRDGAGAVVDWIHRDVNPAGLRILRLERAQVVGKPVSQLVPERVAEWLPGWRRVLESGESWSYETSFGGIAFLVTAFRMDRDTLGTAAVDLSRTLRKLLPLCAWCGRIRNDAGDFEQLEQYLRDHTEATFSHGLCPECARRHFANVLE